MKRVSRFTTGGLSSPTTSTLAICYTLSILYGSRGPAVALRAIRAQVPAALTDLSAAAASSTQINLNWTDTTGETSYEVEYSMDGVTWALATGGSLGANANSFSDTGLVSDTTYYYRVKAVNANGYSISNITLAITDVSAPTPNAATFASAPSPDSDTAISMTATTGTDFTGPVEYYFTETSGNPGGGDSVWQTSPSYTDTGLTASTLYTYTVTCPEHKNGHLFP